MNDIAGVKANPLNDEAVRGEGCSCGHDHSYDHAHEHDHGHDPVHTESCGCDHDHEHDHNHVHSETCDCGHDHGQAPRPIQGPSCGCGCGGDHEHDHAAHIHGPDCDHEHGDDCDCGHDHGETTKAPLDKPALFLGLGLIAAALLPMVTGTLGTLLVTAGTLLVGYPLFVQGIKGLTKLSFDELALMTIAVFAALIIGEAFEAMMVTILFRIGEWLESVAIQKSRRDIEALTEIRPDYANLMGADGGSTQVPAYTVSLGSTIMVRPGERIPLDCEITGGSSFVDTSALTGEPLPRAVGVGDGLLSGSINTDGLLYCRTTRTFENSAASRIIRMVEDSQAKKGDTEKIITRFSKVYTPIVMVLAAALAFLPPLLGFGELTEWVMRALVFLVASCPCAFVIAVPLTFFSGVGAASRMGVLVKGTKYIEILSKADAVAFDKTGTLTYGVPRVDTVIAAPGIDRGDLIALAATAEQYSNHPAAKAVVAYAGEIAPLAVVSFNEITGMGVSLELPDAKVLCGSAKLMAEHGVDVTALPPANIYVAKDGAAIGAITLADELRAESVEAVRELKGLGCKVYMLSGDTDETAQRVGAQVGIDHVRADLLPEDKVTAFTDIKAAHRSSLFVGDGINDAPTLALADAGVAMGLGTDTAIEAADIVLMGERLEQLPAAIQLSRRVMQKAKVNIAFAMVVKVVVLALGALGIAAMWMAVFADVGVTVICVLNAVTLLRYRPAQTSAPTGGTPSAHAAAD